MTLFRTMNDLAAAYPMMNQNPDDNVYHRAFCFWCHDLMGHEYACWAAIQQFKADPNKRRAIFIVETWLRPSAVVPGASLDQSIFDPINTGSVGGKFSMASREGLKDKIKDVKSVQHLSGKLKNWSSRADKGEATAELLADLEEAVCENFFDVMRVKPFSDQQMLQGSSYYATSLRVDVPKLAAVPFDTGLMGLW